MNTLSPLARFLSIPFFLLPTEAVLAQAGTLSLSVNAPNESVAMIEVRSIEKPKQVKVVVHQPNDLIHRIGLAVGNYRVVARPLYSEGVRYVPKADPFVIRIQKESTVSNNVTYVASKGVQNLMVTDITETSVSLDWDAEWGDDTFVRRVEGDEAASSPSQGVAVRLNGSSLIDSGLKPGTTYTYSIFARPGDGAYGRAVIDPVTITVGTVPAAVVVGVPTFVLDPRTRIFAESDYLTASPTGAGVRLDLQPGVNIPPVGSFISLPISETLQGGYLGEVVNVSEDGTTAWLIPAPMASAFDVYSLTYVGSLDDTVIGTGSAKPKVETSALSKNTGVAIDEPTTSKEKLHKRYRRLANFQSPFTDPRDAFVSPQILAPKTAAAEQSAEPCGPNVGIEVTHNYDFDPSIYFHQEFNTYDTEVLGIPAYGADLDFTFELEVTGTTEIEASIAQKCSFPLVEIVKPLAVGPVPFLLKFVPALTVEVGGLTSISSFGFKKNGGFHVDGHGEISPLPDITPSWWGLINPWWGLVDSYVDLAFDGQLLDTKTEVIPIEGNIASTLEITVGAPIEVGPGVGTKYAGVLAGVGGEFNILNAKATFDGLCGTAEYQWELGIYGTVEAWLPSAELGSTVEIEQLQGAFPWPGSPWDYPDGCGDSGPTGDVIGEGVVVVDSNLSGLSNQLGKVEGFVPGEKAWVLSTGDIKDVVGDPSYFSSTDLGQPGNGELSKLSGHATYDAVTYTATVIPSGHTLHVRYVFASEEYPEYVGSAYNDVMAIFVDGQNCAVVPGAATPVAINTINQYTNSQYYVDNQYGASGYGTSMDGLTVPLTCSVPVAPGVPVTLEISVADASDAIYDSAIALLDRGIWSD